VGSSQERVTGQILSLSRGVFGNLLLGLAIIAGIPGSAYGGTVSENVIRVCPQCPLVSPKQAIQEAPPGSVILIGAGIYRESGLEIRKPLRLIGEAGKSKPVIDGGQQGTVIFVSAPDVEISGLEIRNSGMDYVEDLAGIKIMDSEGCRVLHNDLIGNTFGIFLGQSNSCLIEGNRVESAQASDGAKGNGIHVWHGEGLVLLDNVVTRNRDGIYFEFVKKSRILRNRSIDNHRYGLHFMFSNEDEYRDNVFDGNGSGVAVMYSTGIRMVGNRFSRSFGGSAYGILLKDISASEVRANVFTDNTVGAFLEGTTRSNFMGNVFLSNGWALRVLGNTDSNLFEANDFKENTFDVATNAGTNMNRFTGNYWDSYRGMDLDRDGLGDDPFRPVRLSSLLMEKYGVSVLLLKSFFFSVVDQVESILPLLTPETYRDDRPRMKPVAEAGTGAGK